MDVFDVIGWLESDVSSWVEGQMANALKGSGCGGRKRKRMCDVAGTGGW